MDNWNKRMTCAEARDMDIVNYLAELGIQPVRIRGVNFWYLSPLRNEKTPSFKVNRKINRWYDFGEGIGGNLIDFAIKYNNCTVGEFMKNLSDGYLPIDRPIVQPQPIIESNPSIIYLKDYALISYPLLNYLSERRIPVPIADKFCREVIYTFTDKDSQYFAIGFKNDTGGWELRNPYFKGSISPKNSTFLPKGNMTLCVFEGFIDFLSFLTIIPDATYEYDFLILNSLSFFEQNRPVMEKYQEVWLFFDRDHSGLVKTSYAQSLSPIYKDKSNLYKNYKDVNDCLTNKRNI